jgi:hypothetical protein
VLKEPPQELRVLKVMLVLKGVRKELRVRLKELKVLKVLQDQQVI